MRSRRADDIVLPAVTALSAALAVAGTRFARRHPGVDANVVIAVGAALGTAAIAVAERVAPFDPDWTPSRASTRTDLFYLFVSGPPTAAAASAVASTVGARAARWFRDRNGRTPWPGTAPPVVRFGVAILVSEFVHYWHHRAAHRYRPLWRLHAIHHSPTQMSWTTSFRFHPLDHLTLLASQSVGLLALGMDQDTYIAYSIFKGIHGQIQHANIGARSGPMGLVLSGAEQHRWHHAQRHGHPTVNHGAVLSIWDRVFGTYYLPADASPPPRIGLDQPSEVPTGILGQLVAPFSRSGDTGSDTT